MLGDLHSFWGVAVIAIDGVVGVTALVHALLKRTWSRPVTWLVGFALAASGLQVLLGVVLYAGGERPGSTHLFYGVLMAFSLGVAYIYRAELAKRPELRWGLLLLFMMGLAVRATLTYGA